MSDLPKVPPLLPPGGQKPVRPWDLLNANKKRVEAELKEERMAICKTCPFFIKATSQCKKCGCFMNLKTQLAEAFCPVGKWHSVDVPFDKAI